MVWFHEKLFSGIKLGVEGKLLCHKRTKFQDLEVYDTLKLGRVLVLDGIIQTTERDEFIYHEMMTHPLLLAHPNPKNVLIIGGGDGGILREVLKHPVEKATMVEIDADIIEVCKEYLPSLSAGAFNDKRAEIITGDGAKFVKDTKEKYDVVIVDSTDPVGPSKVLFQKQFYEDIFSVLSVNGMMIMQSGSSFYQPDEMPQNVSRLKEVFVYVVPVGIAVPTYVGGFFSLIWSSKEINPRKSSKENIAKKFLAMELDTKYYTPEIHFASMELPVYMQKD